MLVLNCDFVSDLRIDGLRSLQTYCLSLFLRHTTILYGANVVMDPRSIDRRKESVTASVANTDIVEMSTCRETRIYYICCCQQNRDHDRSDRRHEREMDHQRFRKALSSRISAPQSGHSKSSSLSRPANCPRPCEDQSLPSVGPSNDRSNACRIGANPGRPSKIQTPIVT